MDTRSYEVAFGETASVTDADGVSSSRALRRSTTLALIMAILGSSVLPVSYAFATTGVAAGVAISLIVAFSNAYTCHLLLDAAKATRTTTFEELAAAVGGTGFMRFSQLFNVVLLVGNLTGDMCLLADLGSKSLLASLGSRTPQWLVQNHGRGIMLMLVAFVIFPLSLFRGMRALEHVASAGNLVVIALFGVLTYDAWTNGFRGITSGEVPLWTLDASSSHIAEAFAMIGFSFYLHPLMMPMLQELPAGERGVQVMKDAVTLVIMVISLGTFSYIGIMGSAAFGADTQGDIMMNHLIPNVPLSLVFLVAMLVYLSSCIPPIVLSLRSYIDFIIAGPRAPWSWRRMLLLTSTIIAVPLCLAARDPSVSEHAFALTGATGVCVVCYLIPIVAHFKLMFFPRDDDGQPSSTGALSTEERLLADVDRIMSTPDDRQGEGGTVGKAVYSKRPSTVAGWVVDVGLPIAVLLVGCGLSALALYDNLVPKV